MNKDIYIVDLQPLFNNYNYDNQHNWLYEHYPFKDIIEDIMQADYYVDYSDLVIENVIKKVPEDKYQEILSDDYKSLEVLTENIIKDLDSILLKAIYPYIEIENYVLDKWLGESSVVIIDKEKYSAIKKTERCI